MREPVVEVGIYQEKGGGARGREEVKEGMPPT